MRVDIKIILLVFIGFCLVCENNGWWGRRSSSSRSSSRSSSSRSSSSRSSSSRSSSSRYSSSRSSIRRSFWRRSSSRTPPRKPLPPAIKTKTVVNAQAVETSSKKFYGYGALGVAVGNGLGIKTSISGKMDRIKHSGVLVTTKDGKKYLVHKVKDKNARGTVVEEVKGKLDKSWKKVKPSKDITKKATVDDYAKVGGSGYKLWGDNCHDATKRMMENIKRRRRYI